MAERKAKSKSSIERYRALLSRMRDGVIETDRDGHLSYVSDRAAEIFGADSAEDLLDRPLYGFIERRSRRRETARFKEIASGRRPPPGQMEWAIHKANGQRATISISPFPLTEDGRVLGVGAIVCDVTRRMDAERERRKSEERLRAVIEHMPAMLVAMNAKRQIVFWNHECTRVTGYTSEEILNNNNAMALLYPDSDYRRWLNEEWDHRGDLYRDLELEITCHDDTIRTVAWSSIAARAPIPGWSSWAVGIDVTERKRAERDQRQMKELYRRLAENARDLVWRTDEKGTIVYVNAAARTLLGLEPLKVVGRTTNSLLTKDSAASFRRLARKSLSQNPPKDGFRAEIEYLHHDGSRVPCEVNATLVLDSEGRLMSIVGISRDITERVEAEQERAAEEALLRRAQRMESIGRLARGVAHGFNDLLTAITCSCEFLTDDISAQSPGFEHVKEILQATRRAEELAGQLLLVGQRKTVHPVNIDIRNALYGMEPSLRLLVGDDIELEMEVGEESGVVEVDPEQLEQVIMNLVVHAREAMKHGGRLSIVMRNVEVDDVYAASHHEIEPGQFVMLEVSDTGSGMTEEKVSQIFEPFSVAKNVEGADGLGLSIVYGIVSQAGGHISVFSDLGEGTTFSIYLPRRTSNGRAKQESQPDERPSIPDGAKIVLVIEDEVMVRRATIRVLSRAGYYVLCAAEGEEALEIERAHDGPIHLVLSDVILPGLRGPEIAQRILLSRPETRIMYMSGYLDEKFQKTDVLDDGHPLLRKPFTPKDLLKRVGEVLED